MRRLVLKLALILLAVLAQAPASFSSRSARHSAPPSYKWVRATDPGKPGWPRWVLPVAGKDGKLWMIDEEFVWSSVDGIHWDPASHNGKRAVRAGVTPAFFSDRFWLMGGMNSWAEFTNEVWRSNDGVNWQMAAPHAAWGPRRNALLVSFKQKLWLLGGQISAGRETTPTSSYHDVWNTGDGVNWTRVSDRASWSGGCALVFNDRIWVIADGNVWNSTDGRTWNQIATGRELLQRRANGCVVFDGKIWIYGGLRGDKMRNDVWNSADGKEWNLVAEQAPWFPRGTEYTVVHDNKLWIFGGKTGVDYDQADDIWYMARQ
jgi:hypothetical protein